jgi:hypothetical protein
VGAVDPPREAREHRGKGDFAAPGEFELERVLPVDEEPFGHRDRPRRAVGLDVDLGQSAVVHAHGDPVAVARGGDYLIRFTKDVSFWNKLRLTRQLARIPPGSRVLIDGTRAMFIDHDVYDVIRDFHESAALRGIRVQVRNIEGKEYRFLLKRL